ncbi:unnamed protein product [Auanema sp. JU1783]|nr:unnamed protein product [Auanema sp. JU1783]
MVNKTRFFDAKYIRLLIQDLKDKYAEHTEIILNLTISIMVIAFISYQVMTLLTTSKKYDRRKEGKQDEKKETSEKGVSDDGFISDLHAFVYDEKEIPFFTPLYDDDESLKKSQFFYEQMKMRRSIRTFSGRPVSLKVIQNLIKTAGSAPSVGNAQPWVFCVIVRDDLKHDIRSILEADERENYTKRKGVEWIVDVSSLQSTWSRPYITDAPYLLAICHEVFKNVEGQLERMYHYNEMSTLIAVGVLLTAIQNIGLCTVVTSPLNAGPQISRLLKRPDNESLLLLLPLGYPAEDATVPDFKRKPVEHIIKLY